MPLLAPGPCSIPVEGGTRRRRVERRRERVVSRLGWPSRPACRSVRGSGAHDPPGLINGDLSPAAHPGRWCTQLCAPTRPADREPDHWSPRCPSTPRAAPTVAARKDPHENPQRAGLPPPTDTGAGTTAAQQAMVAARGVRPGGSTPRSRRTPSPGPPPRTACGPRSIARTPRPCRSAPDLPDVTDAIRAAVAAAARPDARRRWRSRRSPCPRDDQLGPPGTPGSDSSPPS